MKKKMGYPPTPAPIRLWRRVDRSKSESCWLWPGAKTIGGYGHMLDAGRIRGTHVIAYEDMIGPVPLGLELDHLCRNRACCNPKHMEPVTRRQNLLRSPRDVFVAGRNGTCTKGHPVSGENVITYTDSHGVVRNRCRICYNVIASASQKRVRLRQKGSV